MKPPPRPDLLICAYLGARFKKLSEDGDSYEKQAKRLGTSKQNLMKLANGGTRGTAILYVISDGLFGGSWDAMRSNASIWWAQLPESEHVRLLEWADAQPMVSNATSQREVAEIAFREARSQTDADHGKRQRATVGHPKSKK